MDVCWSPLRRRGDDEPMTLVALPRIGAFPVRRALGALDVTPVVGCGVGIRHLSVLRHEGPVDLSFACLLQIRNGEEVALRFLFLGLRSIPSRR